MKKLILAALAAMMLCSCGASDNTVSNPNGGLQIYTVTTTAETAAGTEKATETSPTVTQLTETAPDTEAQTSKEPPQEAPADEQPLSKAEKLLGEMTIREKVGQLFMIRPDALLFNDYNDHGLREVSGELKDKLADFPVGGLIMFESNIISPEQISAFNSDLQSASRVPLFITTDEEGGRVARIANNKYTDFGVERFSSMLGVAAGGDTDSAYHVGMTIGAYLSELGFNLDLAPVADVNTNPDNVVIGDRAFGSDPVTAAGFVSACVDGFHASGVMTCLKHFPGHGDTKGDTNRATVRVDKSWDELKACELIPFTESLDKTDMIMAAHITLPNITGSDTPASLSHVILTEKLRNELGYEGVIITDALAMDAVKNTASSEAAVKQAVEAGADILLIPEVPYDSFEALTAAVESGEISEERLNESVLRILKLKEKYGLLQ